ncbi:hypothetical protein ES708_06185 [subsurface metagenome]
MSEELLARVRANIDAAEADLKGAKDLVQRLRRAGEDVSELEQRQRAIELRVSRMKKAFAD